MGHCDLADGEPQSPRIGEDGRPIDPVQLRGVCLEKDDVLYTRD